MKQGDLVLIFGSDEDLPLVEDIAVEVRKQGASSLVSVGSNRLSRRMYDEVPAKFDSQTPAMMMQLAGIVDVIINTEAGEGRTLQGVDPKRIAAQGKAFAPVASLMQKRGVRTVALGNGLYPSAERAEQFGISREELADMMYGGIGRGLPGSAIHRGAGTQGARRRQGSCASPTRTEPTSRLGSPAARSR